MRQEWEDDRYFVVDDDGDGERVLRRGGRRRGSETTEGRARRASAAAYRGERPLARERDCIPHTQRAAPSSPESTPPRRSRASPRVLHAHVRAALEPLGAIERATAPAALEPTVRARDVNEALGNGRPGCRLGPRAYAPCRGARGDWAAPRPHDRPDRRDRRRGRPRDRRRARRRRASAGRGVRTSRRSVPAGAFVHARGA